MSTGIQVQNYIESGKPFIVVVSNYGGNDEDVKLNVSVGATNSKFAVEEGGALAEEHTISVPGAARRTLTIHNWGAPAVGTKVTTTATEADGDVVSGTGRVVKAS